MNQLFTPSSLDTINANYCDHDRPMGGWDNLCTIILFYTLGLVSYKYYYLQLALKIKKRIRKIDG